MKKIDVLTIGGATLDLMMYTDECEIINNPKNVTRQKLIGFEYGAKINTDDVHLTFGGGAANTAINFAKQGLKVAVRCNVGGDATGEDMRGYFKKSKVLTGLLSEQKNGHTGFSVIVNTGKKNEHVIFLYRGANHIMQLKARDFSTYRPEWVYLTSLTGPKCKRNFDLLFEQIKKHKLKLAWNPGNEQLKMGYVKLRKYVKHVTVFNTNKDEAIELVMTAKKKTTKIKELLKTIQSWGPQMVVITNGPKGAYVYDGTKYYYSKALPVVGVNTTGAGDSFGSTFITGLIKTKGNIQHALSAAIANSNYVIQEIGAQEGLQTWPEIQKIIKKYKLKT